MSDALLKTGVIAIVDDDAPLREALGSVMKAAGFLTSTFASAEDFLDSANWRDTACLILDVRLPGMSGVELQKRLAEAGSQVPIVFVTANATDENRRMASILGAKGFLSKPVRRQDLLNIVRAAIPS